MLYNTSLSMDYVCFVARDRISHTCTSTHKKSNEPLFQGIILQLVVCFHRDLTLGDSLDWQNCFARSCDLSRGRDCKDSKKITSCYLALQIEQKDTEIVVTRANI